METQATQFLLINTKVLPRVYTQVISAKELLESGEAPTLSEACKQAGISRSVFYKYRDNVFRYRDTAGRRIFTLQMYLSDRPGVLSSVLGALYAKGANLLTVNQNIPTGSIANVTVSVTLEDPSVNVDDLIGVLGGLNGVSGARMV